MALLSKPDSFHYLQISPKANVEHIALGIFIDRYVVGMLEARDLENVGMVSPFLASIVHYCYGIKTAETTINVSP